MANTEVLLTQHFNADLNLPAAFTQIPAIRPTSFITVERIGGATDLLDTPTFAVQCWHRESRYQASQLADLVIQSLDTFEATNPLIGEVEISAYYNFPDSSGDNRYQIVARITAIL